MRLPTFYIVATEYPNLGLGSAGDITADWNTAYDQYAESVMDRQPTRVFVLDFDTETNAFETAREVTDEFQAEYEMICEQRGLTVAAE